MLRRLLNIASIVCLVACVALMGCETRATNKDKIDILFRPHTTSDLERFYAVHSLGRTVHIQTNGRLVFAQTFPYSGLLASHLFVYADEREELRFIGFLCVPTQTDVKFRNPEAGVTEIWAEEKRFAAIDQPSGESVEPPDASR
jgi:hypothetical protein